MAGMNLFYTEDLQKFKETVARENRHSRIGGIYLAGKKPTNITVYRKKTHINIGLIIFGAVFIYLVVLILLYLTSDHVSAYEVREGSILKDRAYNGFVVRDEKVIKADENGYVNYFAPEGSKVGAKTNVYTISGQRLDFEDQSGEESEELSADEQKMLQLRVQSFGENFKEEEFLEIYTLKDSILSVLESKSSQNRHAQLTDMLEREAESLNVYKGTSDGVVIYSVDGYENIDISKVTEDMISKDDYKRVDMQNNAEVKKDDPVYRLIRSDTWTVVIQLSDETAKEMSDTKRVKVRFAKDNETATADFEIYNTPKANLGFLTFQTGMIRYAKDRYLDIELILEDESGLKIPKSSVVKKDFYVVPEEYLTQGGNSKTTGVLLKDGSDDAKFKEVSVYYRDYESGQAYLDPNIFEDSTTLIKMDSNETYNLKETKSLKGVYNINKGYAVFKQIKILCESEEYYIIESGSDYGLSNYDHIALDGTTIHENDVVFN